MIVHIHKLPVPWPPFETHVYLIGAKGKSWILIDTGFPSENGFSELLSFLEKHGGIDTLEAVVLTHGHPDHYGNAFRLKELKPEVQVFAHGDDINRVVHLPKEERRRAAIMGQDYLLRNGTPEDRLDIVSSQSRSYFTRRYQLLPEEVQALDEELSAGGLVLRVFPVPGHTPGHIVLFHEGTGSLFCGDHLYPKGVPVPLLYFPVPEERFRNLPAWLKSLEIFEMLQPGTVYPGHFGPFENWREILQKVRSRTERKKAAVLEILKQGPRTVYDLGKELYPGIPDEFWSFRFSEAQGFLDVLEEEGLVEQVREGEKTYYHLSGSGLNI